MFVFSVWGLNVYALELMIYFFLIAPYEPGSKVETLILEIRRQKGLPVCHSEFFFVKVGARLISYVCSSKYRPRDHLLIDFRLIVKTAMSSRMTRVLSSGEGFYLCV